MEKKRSYHSSRREQGKKKTVEDILEAAVLLHSKGETSIQVLAEEAGVSVATVRKHFPTMEDIFRGCTLHFSRKHNPPPPEIWIGNTDISERVSLCVARLFEFYELSIGVIWLAFRIQDESPVMKEVLAGLEQYLDMVVDTLLGIKPDMEPVVRKTVRALLHPLSYRAMRLHGELSPGESVKFVSKSILIQLK